MSEEESNAKEKLKELIKEQHKKILDDWVKAYLAKRYQLGQSIHPGCFNLVQRCEEFAIKYHFEPTEDDIFSRNDWQPIETAPKDGSTILLWGKKYPDHLAFTRWNEESQSWSGPHLTNYTHWTRMPPIPRAKEEWEEAGYCCKNLYFYRNKDDSQRVTISSIQDELKYCPWCGGKTEETMRRVNKNG